MTLYLIRHAEAKGNKNRIFHGISNGGVTERGAVQAARLSVFLSGLSIDRIYSSDLRRAYETAAVFSVSSGIDIIKRTDLREIDGGLWENKPWSVLPFEFPEEYRTWEYEPHLHKMPGGESMSDVYERSYSAIKKIVSENEGKNVAVFTHGTFIRVLLCRLHGFPFDRLADVRWHENTAVTKIIYVDDTFRIAYEGKYDHLAPCEATVLNQDWNI